MYILTLLLDLFLICIAGNAVYYANLLSPAFLTKILKQTIGNIESSYIVGLAISVQFD